MAANGTGGALYNPGAPAPKKKHKRPANQNAGTGYVPQPQHPHRPHRPKPHHPRPGNGTGGAPAPRPRARKPQDPLDALASRYANLAYGQPLNAVNQDLANVQPYFQDFINHVNASNALYTQQAQPLLAQAQQQQQIAGTAAPDASNDPQAQLAAQSRDALAGLGLTALQGIVSANQGYFAGQAGPVAAAGQLNLQTQLGREKRQILADKGNYQATKREDLRQEQHKEKLENAAFGLQVTQEQNDQATARAKLRQDQRQANNEVITSGPFAGFTKAEVRKLSPSRKNHLRKKSKNPDAVITSGAFAGYTQTQLRGMSQQKKNKLIHAYQQHGSSSGSSAFTPTQVRASRSQVRKGIAAVKSQIAVPGYKPDGFWGRAYKGLVNEKGYDPELARAVIQIMRHGKVSPQLRRKLQRDFGITGDAFRGKKVNLPPGASEVPVVGGIVGLGGI